MASAAGRGRRPRPATPGSQTPRRSSRSSAVPMIWTRTRRRRRRRRRRRSPLPSRQTRGRRARGAGWGRLRPSPRQRPRSSGRDRGLPARRKPAAIHSGSRRRISGLGLRVPLRPRREEALRRPRRLLLRPRQQQRRPCRPGRRKRPCLPRSSPRSPSSSSSLPPARSSATPPVTRTASRKPRPDWSRAADSPFSKRQKGQQHPQPLQPRRRLRGPQVVPRRPRVVPRPRAVVLFPT